MLAAFNCGSRMKPIFHSFSRRVGLRCLLLALVAALVPGARAKAASAPELAIHIDQDKGRLNVAYGGRVLLVYAFASGQYKPYVKELRTIDGANVLVDSPPDHLHHHGLMFAIRVNGHNFWEERDKPGHERHIEFVSKTTSAGPDGTSQAVFVERLAWVADEFKDVSEVESRALVLELRTLTLSVNEKAGEVALRWDGQFTVGPGADKARLEGADYHGLGMRFPASFDKVARHRNSELKAYKTADQRDVIEARWSAITGTLEGREVTVACMGRPDAQRGALKFFTMLDPFAYLSATRGLDLVPQEYQRGETWRDSHLILVRNAATPTETLQKRYEAWTQAKR
jgi:hypothetical protein